MDRAGNQARMLEHNPAARDEVGLSAFVKNGAQEPDVGDSAPYAVNLDEITDSVGLRQEQQAAADRRQQQLLGYQQGCAGYGGEGQRRFLKAHAPNKRKQDPTRRQSNVTNGCPRLLAPSGLLNARSGHRSRKTNSEKGQDDHAD